MTDNKSYMELCLQLDGKENVYLRVPTLWDDVEKQWLGFVKTPKTLKVISGKGRTSFDLQNDFNRNFSKAFHESEELAEELFNMFKPLSFYHNPEE